MCRKPIRPKVAARFRGIPDGDNFLWPAQRGSTDSGTIRSTESGGGSRSIAASGQSAVESTFGEKNLLADVAFLTGALIVFLMLIFGVENRAAFDIGKGGNLSVRSLIAFGATSRDMVDGRRRVVADRPRAAAAFQRLAPHRQLRGAVFCRHPAGADDRPRMVRV